MPMYNASATCIDVSSYPPVLLHLPKHNHPHNPRHAFLSYNNNHSIYGYIFKTFCGIQSYKEYREQDSERSQDNMTRSN